MSNKHTPTPWIVEDIFGDDKTIGIVQKNLSPHDWSCIAMVVKDDDLEDQEFEGINWLEQKANAELIITAVNAYEANQATIKALTACLILQKEVNTYAMPKFNWGNSNLDAHAIDLLNRGMIAIDVALKNTLEQHK